MKPVHFMGSSREDIKKFPEDVRSEVGFTVYLAQQGDKALNAVPMVGFGGAKVLEVVIDEGGDTYRAVYTVKFAKAIYVLHAFQKKAKHGIGTPKPDMQLIHKRLQSATAHYKATYENVERKERTHGHGA